MKENLKVSVCMITYGHEKYIREAIEGILMQECDFEVELILANDCSPDSTDKVIQNILENHPKRSWIKYFNHKENLGMMPNFIFALGQCSGNYVAMCEGDDYWITKDKLQKQVDILEENKKVGLVYTNVKYFIQNKEQFVDIPARFAAEQSEVIPMMLKSKFIEFATTVFRKAILDKVLTILEKELENKVIGDTRILLETLHNSSLYFLNETTTVYRIIDGSASHPIDLEKFVFALLDSYHCRKEFVKRNNFNKTWLSDSICNTNRGLINRAFVSQSYSDVYKLMKNLLILDTFQYCTWGIFKRKMNFAILLKFILSCFGIGIIRQKLNGC
ncbi:glycosyltransferase [Flavobacterium sp. M31R6]|uniref:glycosyltransferase n=1 Tax=Flavobacterium sp. M31R6 TaxID=2739062 RepID=UPI00156855F5|nr:glycosyltransferase [Flavobacterium sp. M31R6]QKJ64805.1 glycosyltransferase [Flavobacterium sp. M31R6]